MIKKHNIIFGVVAMISILSSCSKEEIKVLEEFSTPQKTYRLWLETAEKEDLQSNSRCVTEASKRLMDFQLRQMDEFMRRLSANVAVFKTYTIAEQKIKDDKAVVVLRGPKGHIIVVPLKMEEEGWKVDLISLFGGGG